MQSEGGTRSGPWGDIYGFARSSSGFCAFLLAAVYAARMGTFMAGEDWTLRLMAELAGGYLVCGFFTTAHDVLIKGHEANEFDVFIRRWQHVAKTFLLLLLVGLVIGVVEITISFVALLLGSAGQWIFIVFNGLCIAMGLCFLACVQDADFLAALLRGAKLLARARGTTLTTIVVYLSGVSMVGAALKTDSGVLGRALWVVVWQTLLFGCGLAYLSYRRRYPLD